MSATPPLRLGQGRRAGPGRVRSRAQAATSLIRDRARSWLRSGSGAVATIAMRVFVAAVLAFNAPTRATRSIRIASVGPVASFGAPAVSPPRAAGAAASATTASLLPPDDEAVDPAAAPRARRRHARAGDGPGRRRGRRCPRHPPDRADLATVSRTAVARSRSSITAAWWDAVCVSTPPTIIRVLLGFVLVLPCVGEHRRPE